jgi:hypothetical protein
MENEIQDEVIVDNEEANNEEKVEETTEEPTKVEKPKRTPQEEYDYHNGRAQRIAKKLGLNTEKTQPKEVVSSSKPSELSDGQIAILRTEGIKSKAELALFKEVMGETGKGVLDLLDSSYFQSRLTDFRATQESLNAIPKGKNRSGQTGVTDADIAHAKFKETGQLPEDFKTRVDVVNKAVEAERSKNMFSGPAVIGPQGQGY